MWTNGCHGLFTPSSSPCSQHCLETDLKLSVHKTRKMPYCKSTEIHQYSVSFLFYSYLLYVTTQRKSLKRSRRRKRRKSCPRIPILSGTARQATIQHFQISNNRKKTRQQTYPECGRNPNPALSGLHCPVIRFVSLSDKNSLQESTEKRIKVGQFSPKSVLFSTGNR